MVTYQYDLTSVAGITMNPGEVATKTIDSKGDAVLRIFDKNGRLSRVIDMIAPMSTVTYQYDPVGNQREVLQSLKPLATAVTALKTKSPKPTARASQATPTMQQVIASMSNLNSV